LVERRFASPGGSPLQEVDRAGLWRSEAIILDKEKSENKFPKANFNSYE